MGQQVAVVHDIKAASWQRVIFDKFVGYWDSQLPQSPVVSRIGLEPDYFIPVGAYGGEEEPGPTADLNQSAMRAVSRYPRSLEPSRQGIKVIRMVVSRQIQRLKHCELVGVNHAAPAKQTLYTVFLPDHLLGGLTAKETHGCRHALGCRSDCHLALPVRDTHYSPRMPCGQEPVWVGSGSV